MTLIIKNKELIYDTKFKADIAALIKDVEVHINQQIRRVQSLQIAASDSHPTRQTNYVIKSQ